MHPVAKFLSRVLAVGLLAVTPVILTAQAAPAAKGYPTGDSPSRWDIFAGYSYLAPHGSVTSPSPAGGPFSYDSINYGAIGSVARYFNKYTGIEAIGDVHQEDESPDANGISHPNDDFGGGSGGLIFRFPTDEVTPFVHVLLGVERVGGPDDQPDAWGFVATAGGGMDYATPWFNHHLAIRLFQADWQYTHENFGTGYFGGRANVNAARLSAGIVYHIGTIAPPPPVTLSCSANPTSVFPGDPVTITATPGMLDPKMNVIYSWSGSGVTGNGTTATVATTALAPGSYTVKGSVKEGKPGKEGLKPWQNADCSASFTVKAFEPPTISCSANPTTIKPGETSSITAQGLSPQNRPLTYSYSATAGTISGSGATASFASAGAPTGAVGITCSVTDDKGQTATANTSVTITAPYIPPAPHTQALCSVTFDKDKKRPTRVDNEAKACLDQVALDLQNQADAKAVVVGESDGKEKIVLAKQQKAALKNKHIKVIDPAAERAVNTKEYLVTEKGIDASRIGVATGSTDGKTVEDYLVPSGATFTTDVQGTTPVDETAVKPVVRKPLGAKPHHKKAAASK
jgi:hypothetical protein